MCKREKRKSKDWGSEKSWSVFGILHVGRKMVSKRDIEGSKAGRIIWYGHTNRH